MTPAIPARRRVLTVIVLLVLLLGEVVFGPGPCDSSEHGRTAVTR